GQIRQRNVKLINLDYTFKNPTFLDLALTQSGVNAIHNNERLEFIGDRVLGLSVASLLYELYPNEDEGKLAPKLALLVSAETLSKVAVNLGIDKHIKHGHLTAGKQKNILADAMEAIIGAIYLDSDFNTANTFIKNIWINLANTLVLPPKDAKSILQEIVQQQKSELPVYEYTDPIGPADNPQFSATVTALGKSATGTGSSKKQASIQAAENLLKILAI
ncbi:MAG: ribonuclease III, partial [Alphaproteobacteria bacterium]|nr:ribonuclease III [Alphaproteobacteria bacterium]